MKTSVADGGKGSTVSLRECSGTYSGDDPTAGFADNFVQASISLRALFFFLLFFFLRPKLPCFLGLLS